MPELEGLIVVGGGGSVVCCLYAAILAILLHLPMVASSCGTCVTILVMIPCVVVVFFGGIVLNAGVYGIVTAQICDFPIGFCCAVPAFFNVAGILYLSTGAGSPVIRYEELENTPDIRSASVCDPHQWDGSKGGIYFRDGTLTRGGSLPPVTVANVTHCNYVSGDKNRAGYWRPCRFGLRPIFECDSDFGECLTRPPCAWAVTQDGEPPVPAACDGVRAGLCGLSMSVPRLAPVCWGPDATVGMTPEAACWRGEEELHDGIKAALEMNRLPPEDVPGSDLPPLIELVSPVAARAQVAWWYHFFLVIAFVYVPLPVCCLAVCIGGEFVKADGSESLLGGA